MQIIYLDCVAGASGDMLLGALVDAGAAEAAVQAAVTALHLDNCSLTFEITRRGAISARRALVHTPEQPSCRHLPDLLAIVERAALDAWVKKKALGVLQRLGEAEATIHGEALQQVHLHEVGGDDALIDVVGVLAALHDLKVERVYVSPLPLGRGWVQSAHGQLPLPAPATLALLRGAEIKYQDCNMELVTPTGAALLSTLAFAYGGFPPMTLAGVGVGAGQRELSFPNIVRAWLGEISSLPEGLLQEELVLLETNIDDCNPQIYAHVMQRLFDAGALDVTLTPVQMKKNRPGILLAALAEPALAETLTGLILAETSTLGVRRSLLQRVSLPRHIETVDTPYGSIRMKVAAWNGNLRAAPEYEDCLQAARQHGVALQEVLQAAQVHYHRQTR